MDEPNISIDLVHAEGKRENRFFEFLNSAIR